MRHPVRAALAILGIAGAAALLTATPASAHVVPATTIALDVHEDAVTAHLTLPAEDLAAASGVFITDSAVLEPNTAAQVETYLEDHLGVTSPSGVWGVAVDGIASSNVEQWGTGEFDAILATATLTPPAADEVRSFTLDTDLILHEVVTADIFVTLHSDWAAGVLESSRALGTIGVDTVSGTVAPLTIDLDDGSTWQAFTGMVALGAAHIADGTDHQLFLVTLLLVAPILAVSGRWNGAVTARTAGRRITTITIAFTLGHSLTLGLGALGLPVPAQPVEALIAASILVAAAHAARPMFPGREAVVAGAFGLVHGMAFASTLTALDLTGAQLALSLLGFNVGIELMQLAVVLMTLPPLVVLSRTAVYSPLRTVAAAVTGIAAVAWLLDRVGVATPVTAVANSLGTASPWVVTALWAAALAVLAARHLPRRAPGAIAATHEARAVVDAVVR